MSDDNDFYDDADHNDDSYQLSNQDYERIDFGKGDFLNKQRSDLTLEESIEISLKKNVTLLDFGHRLIGPIIKIVKRDVIPHAELKNPLGLLFGYHVILPNFKQIDKEKVDFLVALCEGVSYDVSDKKEQKKYNQISHISASDIIRYARLLMSLSEHLRGDVDD